MSAHEDLKKIVAQLGALHNKKVIIDKVLFGRIAEAVLLTEYIYSVINRPWYKRLFGIGMKALKKDYTEKAAEARDNTKKAQQNVEAYEKSLKEKQ